MRRCKTLQVQAGPGKISSLGSQRSVGCILETYWEKRQALIFVMLAIQQVPLWKLMDTKNEDLNVDNLANPASDEQDRLWNPKKTLGQ